LKRMGQLHYNYSNWQGVTTTAKALSVMGVKDEDLLKKAFPHIKEEWQENKKDKEVQDTVIFIAEQLGEKKYISEFLVWNQRLSEALAIYEKDWQKQQTLPAADLEKALQIASWSKKPKLKTPWLERYLIAPPHDTSAEKLTQFKTDLIYLYVDQQDYQNALKHLKSPETAKEYKYLALIYRKDNNYKKVAATYWKAYEKFNNVKLLEQAYLILASQADMENEVIKLLSLLADYKKDYAFRLAEIYMEQQQYLAALIIYQRIWDKWQHVSALKAAYGIAYKLDDFSKMNSLLRQIYKHTNNIQHLKNLAAVYIAKAPEKMVKLLEEFPILQSQPEYMTYVAYYYLNNGNYKKAEASFLKLSLIDPTNKKYQQALATIYVETAEYHKALAVNRHVWKRWKDIDALKQAYSITYKLKDLQTSEKILWQLYKHTKDKTYLANIASLYSDQPKKLIRFLEQYPFLQNKFLAFLSSYYLQHKNYRKAENYYQALIKKHPKKRDYPKALATIYVITGQISKAQKLTRRYSYLKQGLLPVFASHYLQNKNYKKAERSYKKLIRLYPKKRDYPKALATIYVVTKQMRKVQRLTRRYPYLQQDLLPVLASYYLQHKQFSKAAKYYKKLIIKFPDNKNYPKALATIYVVTKQMRKVQRLTKDNPYLEQELLPVLASYYLQQKNYKQAEKLYQKLNFNYPDKRDYPKVLASIYVETRQFNKVNLLMAEFPYLRKELLPVLASYYLQKKNYPKAENYYQQLIKLNPKNSQYPAGLASIYIETKQTSKAERLINQYPYLKKNFLAFFASYYLQQKNYPKAEQHYKQLIAKNPRKRAYKKVLTSIYIETKQIAKAQQLIKRYRYLQNDFLAFFASHDLQQKNYRQAERSYKKLIRLHPKNRDYPKALAIIYVETKQMRKVQRLTRRYSYLQQELLPMFASYYLQQKNYKQAEKLYQKLNFKYPDKRDYPKVLASIYIQTKQMRKAQTLAKRYPFLQQDLLPVFASYYLQHKNYAKAEVYYQKLSFIYPEKRDYPKALASIYVETRQFNKVNLLMAEFPFLRKELLPVLASYYLQKKNYAKAENYYQQLIKLNPKNSQYPAGLASIYIETKQTSKAERLINQYPYLKKNSLAFFASYYLQQKNYPKAEQHYKQLIAKNPRKRAYKKVLASIYIETKQIATAQQLIKRYPYLQNDFLAFFASYDLQQKNYRQAERSYKKLIRLHPKKRDYPKALAIIYVETKQMRKVQQLTRRYSYLQQQLLPVLASYYLQKKNYKKAENYYKKLIRLHPKKRDYPKALASIYIETKQMPKAQRLIKRYQFLEQDLLPMLASHYLNSKNYSKATIYYRKLIAQHPDKTDYPVALASIYVETTQTMELHQLINEFPFLEENLLPVLASHYLNSKDYQKAATYYQQLCVKSPDNQKYPEILASIYIQTKQEQKLPRLIEQYPILENELLPFLASYNLQQKNYPQAETYYKKLVSRDSEKLDYLEVLASIYVQTEQKNKALPIYKKLHSIKPNKYANNLANHYLYVSKDYLKAITILEGLLKKTNKEQYRLMLAFAYGETNQAGKKARILEQIPLKKISAGLAISLAEAYEQKGHWQKAVKILNKWHQIHNNRKDKIKVLKHQIYLYQRLGDKKRFRDANMMLLKLN
ncbi:tetratricopeptide repeat protein, partial [Candidatus Marithrix sp. Canyon 246]|uniref:tetratricopeptide repeat protein n=1 Tax=Candidatus Marithrix sp. Canyon 246 TaxID=1827136 RepID=UPI000A560AA4